MNLTHINVFLYSDPTVTPSMALFCKSTSCSCGLTLSPMFSVSLNLLFFSFLSRVEGKK
ncbi:hypothetical protein PanWU01x14_353890 [Parasponia andersonii]|uniref:Uncharacterized protein n=1 Tax=Parasponia andersonii TaxID=3476 RepID=A0A2P5A9W0_PARAD|nr:hypothetical protein PanWU01x14_353890 [Parasponia andersonii]